MQTVAIKDKKLRSQVNVKYKSMSCTSGHTPRIRKYQKKGRHPGLARAAGALHGVLKGSNHYREECSFWIVTPSSWAKVLRVDT
jgi:hypothetical protein